MYIYIYIYKQVFRLIISFVCIPFIKLTLGLGLRSGFMILIYFAKTSMLVYLYQNPRCLIVNPSS